MFMKTITTKIKRETSTYIQDIHDDHATPHRTQVVADFLQEQGTPGGTGPLALPIRHPPSVFQTLSNDVHAVGCCRRRQ